jgi:hypothetical protein
MRRLCSFAGNLVGLNKRIYYKALFGPNQKAEKQKRGVQSWRRSKPFKVGPFLWVSDLQLGTSTLTRSLRLMDRLIGALQAAEGGRE